MEDSREIFSDCHLLRNPDPVKGGNDDPASVAGAFTAGIQTGGIYTLTIGAPHYPDWR